MKRQTRTYESVGEMLDAARQGIKTPAAVAAMRAAGTFRKPEGVAANAGTRNPTNVDNPIPKGPGGQKGTVANAARRAKRERKMTQRKKR